MNISHRLNQDAVYWAKTGVDAQGQPTYAAPVAVKCRWEDKTIQILLPSGQQYVTQARVFVAQYMTRGGLLMLGELDTNVETYPRANPTACEIMQFHSTPSLSNDFALQEVFL